MITEITATIQTEAIQPTALREIIQEMILASSEEMDTTTETIQVETIQETILASLGEMDTITEIIQETIQTAAIQPTQQTAPK